MVVFCYVYSIMLCLFYDTVFYVIVCITRQQESQKRLDRLAGAARTETLSAVEERILGIIGSCVVEGNSCYGVFYFTLQPP